jgi:hypothetical protein
MSEVTRILNAIEHGDPHYDELRVVDTKDSVARPGKLPSNSRSCSGLF